MELETLYPFWNQLTADEKTKIEQSCYEQTYEKGMTMHRAQENCMGLLSVISGAIRVYIISDEGREVTLFRVYDGEVCVLSASCLMESIEFEVMMEAVEETKVSVLPIVCLNEVMNKNPQVELYMLKVATEKFSDVMWTMQQIMFKKIDQRIAEYLWDEVVRTKESVLVTTHDEIARNIGSAREVVSKVLKYMAEQNVLELQRGKIVIHDTEKLKALL